MVNDDVKFFTVELQLPLWVDDELLFDLKVNSFLTREQVLSLIITQFYSSRVVNNA
jgi:hypothetical protein